MKYLQLSLKENFIVVEIPREANYEFLNKDSKYLKVGKQEVKLDIPTLSKEEVDDWIEFIQNKNSKIKYGDREFPQWFYYPDSNIPNISSRCRLD